MQYDITALGEILIDFTPAGQDAAGDLVFARKAGGAPVNLLATVAKYGGKTAFIGKVGQDMFGQFLRKTLKSAGIAEEGLITDAVHNTTLAFVALGPNGDRDFSFYRNFGADVFLNKEDVSAEIIRQSKIFHFGSLSLTTEPVRSATEYALGVAKKAGCLITYDPNYRAPLGPSETAAVQAMKLHLNKVDILKIAQEELLLLFGQNKETAVKAAFSHGVKMVLVTNGAKGAALYTQSFHIELPAERVCTVDTTGAGDIFFGAFLSEWLKNSCTLNSITPEKAGQYLKKAIYIAGQSTTKHGAIAAIPTVTEE